MKTIRFTIGPKQLQKLEKDRKVLFRVKDIEYEVVLSPNVDLLCVESDIFDAQRFALTDKSKMN